MVLGLRRSRHVLMLVRARVAGHSGWRYGIRDWGGRQKGQRELLPELAAIPWTGRVVYVIYDSDAVSNPGVCRAEFALARALKRCGCSR